MKHRTPAKSLRADMEQQIRFLQQHNKNLSVQVEKFEKRYDEELQVVFAVLNMLVERSVEKSGARFGFAPD